MDNTSCHRVQSHAAFLPKAELDGGVGGGCYVPWVELVLRSICARKTEVSPGMPPPPEVGSFLFWNSEDRHDPGGVFGRHGCEEKDAVPTRFSPTVTSVVTLRVNVIIASLSLPVVSGQR